MIYDITRYCVFFLEGPLEGYAMYPLVEATQIDDNESNPNPNILDDPSGIRRSVFLDLSQRKH